MSKHPSLELLKKEVSLLNLDKLELQLQELTEQVQLAKALPIAVLDSKRIESILLETTHAYKEAMRISEQFEQILALLQQVSQSLIKKDENVALEREVLLKLKAAL